MILGCHGDKDCSGIRVETWTGLCAWSWMVSQTKTRHLKLFTYCRSIDFNDDEFYKGLLIKRYHAFFDTVLKGWLYNNVHNENPLWSFLCFFCIFVWLYDLNHLTIKTNGRLQNKSVLHSVHQIHRQIPEIKQRSDKIKCTGLNLCTWTLQERWSQWKKMIKRYISHITQSISNSIEMVGLILPVYMYSVNISNHNLHLHCPGTS